MTMFLERPIGARLSLTAGAALLCAHASLFAQSTQPELDALVVTATRTPIPTSQVLADVTVLSRADLERQASGTMADLLSHVPGFQVSRNGGPAADGNVYLRGGESRHIAVLIDGVRVDTQNASGGASWQMLSLSQIDRVEIVRGPVSALYGSDAISGVVQIFTKKGKGPASLDLGVSAGEWGFLKTEAGLSGAAGLFDYAVSASRERSDGFSARTNVVPGTQAADRDGYTTTGGSVRLGFTPVAAHRFEAVATQQHLDAKYDSSSATRDDRTERELSNVKLQWNAQWLDSWLSQVAVGQSTDRYATPLTNYLSQTDVGTAAWLNDFKWGAHSVSTVLERREDTLRNSDLRAFAPQERSDDGLGLGYAWRAHGTAIQLNGRNDWDSEFGQHATGTVAVGQDFAKSWNVHASWGTGYRAPTLYQRFSRYGNPALKPESSRNTEVGVRYRNAGSEWGMTAYHNQIADLISAPTGTNSTTSCSALAPTYCYTNTAQARLQGVSANGRVNLGPVRVSGSVDFDSSKDALTDKRLRRRARQHATLRAETDVSNWTLGGQMLTSAKRFDDDKNTVVLGGYTVFNLDAQYRFNAQWRFTASIENAGDKHYQTALNYANVPRTAIVGLRWTPGL